MAGEASGDGHGAGLMREARAIDPAISFVGIGGREMRAAGLESIHDAESIAVVGFLEVVRHLPVLRRAYAACIEELNKGVDGVVLVDYPGFNLKLAGECRRRGRPVLYFICPQVWAWKPGRIDRIARSVDRMLVVFPFEVDLFRGKGMEVEYVGHPLVDATRSPAARETIAARAGLDLSRPVLGLLPGSRTSEIRRNLPPALGAARLLKRFFRGLQVLFPVASTLSLREIEAAIAPYSDLEIRLRQEPLKELMPACTAAIVSSGTATLETALLEVPMVVIYRLNPFTAALARRLAVTGTFGLVNIVAGRLIMPECIQENCTPEKIAKAVERHLADPAAREAAVASLTEVRAKLGEGGAYERAGRSLVDFLAKRTGAPH